MKLNEDTLDMTYNAGVADILITALNKTWEMITDLNSIATTLEAEGFGDMKPVIEEILADENNHVGQLQTLVELVSPNAANIEVGATDALETIDDGNVEVVLIGEAYKSSNKYSSIVRNNELTEDIEEGPSEDDSWFVSFYDEQEGLIDQVGFGTYQDAIDFINDMKDDLSVEGYEKYYSDYYLKTSPLVHRDQWIKVESAEDNGNG